MVVKNIPTFAMHYIILYSLHLSIFNFLSKQTFKETKGSVFPAALLLFMECKQKNCEKRLLLFPLTPSFSKQRKVMTRTASHKKPSRVKPHLVGKQSSQFQCHFSHPLVSPPNHISCSKAIINSLLMFSLSSPLQALEVIRCLKQTHTQLSHYHP